MDAAKCRGTPMELRAYLAILWRRKWAIVTTAAMTVLVTAVGTFLVTPSYAASATLRVATAATGSPDYVNYDITYADRLMNTYTRIATSGPVLAELAQKLGLVKPPQVDVEVPANTELLKITVEDSNPALTRDAANALASILIAHVQEQYNGGGKTAQDILKEQLTQAEDDVNQARKNYEAVLAQSAPDSAQGLAAKRSLDLREETYSRLLGQYESVRVSEAVRANAISVVEPAVVPLAPSKPKKALNIGLGLLVGLVAGVGLAFLFEHMDTTLQTTEQIEKATKLPILGNIPVAKGPQQITFFTNNSPQEEAFRSLRTIIFMFDPNTPLQKLLLTSAEPGEGKSTIVVNLASAMACVGRKVVVVDADLRLPKLHYIFGLMNSPGLSSVLKQETTLHKAVQESIIPGVYVLTSGPLPPNPAELLSSPQMTGLIEQLAEQFDLVLLDTPALLPVTDAAVLAPIVDGVVLVVGRTQARQEAVRAALRQLSNVKARLVGVIVNRAEQNDGYHYYHTLQSRGEQRGTRSHHR